jgi:16S rRNA (guanine527-N7)-methyltransferase
MAERERLREVLAESEHLGFLGPGEAFAGFDHAAGFAAALRAAGTVLDLGSGGGLPGLLLAVLRPELSVTLLDASVTRTDFLRRAVGRLELGARVRVVTGRAELVVRTPGWRGALDAVVSRSFGPPPVTAECAAGFLRVGGQLLVSEPPDAPTDRWPPDGVAVLGLVRDALDAPGLASFTAVTSCPDRFPRRSLRPPLW